MTELRRRVGEWALWAPAFVVLIAAMLVAYPAFGQSSGGAGVLTGVVLDASDKKPAKDVVVTATSPALQGEQVVVTDGAGFYRIPALPAGEYTLAFEKDGYKQYSRGGIALRTEVTLRVNAELLPTTLKVEEVTAVVKAPTVDVGSSTVGATIGQDFTRRVPTAAPTNKGAANRSFEAVAEVAPGANTDTYGTSIAGTSSPENGYLVDGLSVGNPGNGTIGTPLSSEFVQETNVITGGYMPEYGRTTGGVLSAVTKTGSNEFHGGVFSYFSPGGLSQTPKVVPEAINTQIISTPMAYTYDIGADVGGPIIKDKLWFYVGFDYSTESYYVNESYYHQVYTNNAATGNVVLGPDGNPIVQPISGMDQQYQAVAHTLQAIGKLTYAIDANNRLTATFIASPTTTGGAGKFAVDPLTGGPEVGNGSNGTYSALSHQLNSGAYDTNIKWSTELDNKRVLVDTMVGWHNQFNDVLPSDGTLPGSGQGLSAYPNVSWNAGGGGVPYHNLNQFEPVPGGQCIGPNNTNLCPVPTWTSGGAQNQIAQQQFNRYVIGSTLTYLFEGLGHHVVKVGASAEFTSYDHLKGHTGGTSIIESAQGQLSDAEHFGVLAGPDNPKFLEPFHITTKSLIAGGFVQDSWSILDKVTVNLGIRYDVQEMFAGNGQLGLTMPNEWAPRLGVVYDPTQEGRSKIFASYARYFENIPLGLADGAISGEPSVLATYGGNCTVGAVSQPNGCQNAGSRVPGNAAVGSPTPHSPSQKWGTFGAGADTVDPNVQPTTTDELSGGFEYELFKDARVGVSYTKRWLVRWLEDMSLDDRATFFIGNPGYGIGSGFPAAQRDYDAGTLYLQKNFGDTWLLSASYTLSYLRGNIIGLFGQNGELNPNHNAAFDTKTIMINSSGPLPGDNTHSIKIFGARDWIINKENGISTGLALRAHSGSPLDFFAADAIYGSGTYLLEPRGSGGRLPWVYDVDVNLAYKYSFDKDRTVSIGLDIFNLFGFQEVVSADENYTLANAVGTQNGTLKNVTVYPSGGSPRPLNLSDKNPNFLNPTSFQQPRTFRFGMRGTF
jgi:hypothetical protein